MTLSRVCLVVGCFLLLIIHVGFSGVQSKEVGAVLIFPGFWATTDTDTYLTFTNHGASSINAHVRLIGSSSCSGCHFDVLMAPRQTTRLLLDRDVGLGTTLISDVSSTGGPTLLAACAEQTGFAVVIPEAPGVTPRQTLGDNVLLGDAVVMSSSANAASQFSAIVVQAAGLNDGDRILDFNGIEYTRFPSLTTGEFWAPNPTVDPRLVLFNVNFVEGAVPSTNCSMNYVNAQSDFFSTSFSFACWTDTRLADISPGLGEAALGTANGFLFLQCERGTHGALFTSVSGSTALYPYPMQGSFAQTLGQSVTFASGSARLTLTPALQ